MNGLADANVLMMIADADADGMLMDADGMLMGC